jgi:hypothetical protein
MKSAHFDATIDHMASDDARVGPAGEALAANIKRVREARRLGYAEFSRQLSGIGRPIPELGLRRIELGERRIDADELLAISYVLQVAVVDLLIDKDATTEPYPITPNESFTSDSVREWIRGSDIRLAPIQDHPIFASPGTWMWPALEQMPSDRRRQVMRKHGGEEES